MVVVVLAVVAAAVEVSASTLAGVAVALALAVVVGTGCNTFIQTMLAQIHAGMELQGMSMHLPRGVVFVEGSWRRECSA